MMKKQRQKAVRIYSDKGSESDQNSSDEDKKPHSYWQPLEYDYQVTLNRSLVVNALTRGNQSMG